MRFPNIYSNKHYTWLMLIPVILLVISIILLFSTGLNKGIELQGGLLITVQTNSTVNVPLLEARLLDYSSSVSISEYSSAGLNGIQIEMALDERLLQLESQSTLVQGLYQNYTELLNFNPIDSANLESRLKSEISKYYTILGSSMPTSLSTEELVKGVRDSLDQERARIRNGIQNTIFEVTNSKELSFNEVGSSLSKFFFNNSINALIISFILSALVILIIVRGLVASAAVVSGAIFDLVITAGCMVVFNIDLSLGAVAALLMLISLSLDTDVLLTINVLKRKEGSPVDRAFYSLKTGFLMNLTTLGAFLVLTLIGWFYQIPTYYNIGLIVSIGSIVDFIATGFFNTPFVLWYAERKKI